MTKAERSDQCALCGKTKEQVRKLIVGLRGSVCSDCVDLAQDILAQDPGPLREGSKEPPGDRRDECVLCGKSRDQVFKLITGLHGSVCTDCVDLCIDILGNDGKAVHSSHSATSDSRADDAKFDLGILGGGQLARMSIQAAQRMGLRSISLDPDGNSPASQIAYSLKGRLADSDEVASIAGYSKVLTLENEFIPADAIRKALSFEGAPKLIPGVETLATIQDKLLQRHALEQALVPSPKAVPIEADHRASIEAIGFPMVLKARFGGYDGKGTRYARTEEEFLSHRGLWAGGGWLAEQYVPFKRELAVMVFVSEWGAGCFPTMETIQTNHVCDLVFPAQADGSKVALAAVEAVGGSGLFGVELFELEDGQILVNELAPRPHNTGHYTLDWGATSQFEQHVRCVMGIPLGGVDGLPVCMANLLGQEGGNDFQRATRAAMEDPLVHVHWYGKAEARPGRKMGHLNVVGKPDSDIGELVERAKRARQRFYEHL